jgi:hypothetical protein
MGGGEGGDKRNDTQTTCARGASGWRLEINDASCSGTKASMWYRK